MTTQRLCGMAEHWRFAGSQSDAALARLIYEDGIDILVDLAGHTGGGQLGAFTFRPAPVQATYLGFFAGTGLAAMDYWITDEVLHPPDTPEQAVEEIYRLPRCWVCYRPPEDAPPVAPCPNTDERVVLGSFNGLSKLSPALIETWSQLLHALPGSRLLLMDKHFRETATQVRLVKRFEAHGVASHRLVLRKGAPFREYLAAYATVDIVLDAFPRTGGTTTAEALWMGVPVVTLAGQRYVERISASKLASIGLTALITTSRQAYLERAIAMAHDPGLRAVLRTTLRDRMAGSPLCDASGLARAMEAAFESMWMRYVSNC
jgi:predicted O-linked N-acetylglucosamine transferase (SPINDLY family)